MLTHDSSPALEGVTHPVTSRGSPLAAPEINPAVLPDWLATRLVYALAAEAVTWPKPGLVTAIDNGCHDDMDVYSFLCSASSLQPYYRAAAEYALELPSSVELTAHFDDLRRLGRSAENGMSTATGGINTHRGAIFLGILLVCGAVLAWRRTGRLRPETICANARRISQDALLADLYGENRLAESSGMRAFRSFGVLGIRGEVLAGFPSLLQHGLPTLRASLATGRGMRESLVHALLSLMCVVEDSTVLNRHATLSRLDLTRRLARCAVDAGGLASAEGRAAVEHLCGLFIRESISPGGSADLTAAALYLHLWEAESTPKDGTEDDSLGT